MKKKIKTIMITMNFMKLSLLINKNKEHTYKSPVIILKILTSLKTNNSRNQITINRIGKVIFKNSKQTN